MRADCGCEPRRPARAVVGSSLGVALGLAAALLPKCPLCIAAYLSAIGVGTAAAHTLAPLLFPLGIGLVAISLALLAIVAVRHRRALNLRR
jgi:hypothetical protein